MLKKPTVEALRIILQARTKVVYRSIAWWMLNDAALYLSDKFWEEVTG